MRQLIDLTGQNINRLTVIERVDNDKYGYVKWLCRCECGKETIVRGGNLKNGHTKSCGCLKKELVIQRNYKHGHSLDGGSKTYKTWESMIQRCTNLKNKAYKNYGGRGIKVCKSWLKFEGFFQDMGERLPNMSLDRVDNNRNYCKENCRWATWKEQNRNRRDNRLITINGITKCIIKWCEIRKLPYARVWWRINHGWTPEEALEIISRARK